MKKLVTLALLFSFVGTAAYAMSPEEEKKARYNEIKQYKDQKRASREGQGTDEKLKGEKKPGFWDKEAERSGISGARVGNWFKNMNPVPFFKNQEERYAARKAGSQAGHASDQAVEHASANSAVAATN